MKQKFNLGNNQLISKTKVRKRSCYRYPEILKNEILSKIDKGSSAAVLARKAGISPSVVSGWRKGLHKKSAENHNQLFDFPEPRVINVKQPKDQAQDISPLRFEVGGFTVTISRS